MDVEDKNKDKGEYRVNNKGVDKKEDKAKG